MPTLIAREADVFNSYICFHWPCGSLSKSSTKVIYTISNKKNL